MTLRGTIPISEAAFTPVREKKRAGASSDAFPSLSIPPWALIPECSPWHSWPLMVLGSGIIFPEDTISFEWEVSQAHVPDLKLVLFS